MYWTKLAKDCYNRGCRCSTCEQYKICTMYNNEMKRAVLRLVKNIGKPKIEKGDYFGCR